MLCKIKNFRDEELRVAYYNNQVVEQNWNFMQVLDAFLEQLSDQTTLDGLRISGGSDMAASQLTTTLGLERTLRTI